jgi:hypothetical protein
MDTSLLKLPVPVASLTRSAGKYHGHQERHRSCRRRLSVAGQHVLLRLSSLGVPYESIATEVAAGEVQCFLRYRLGNRIGALCDREQFWGSCRCPL